MNNLIIILIIIIVILLINSQNCKKEGFSGNVNDVKKIGYKKFLNTLKKMAKAEKEYIDGYKNFRNSTDFWEYAVRNYISTDFGKIAGFLRLVPKNGIVAPLTLNIETDDNKKYSAKYFDDLKNKYLNTDISNIPLITEIDNMIENLYERNEPWLRQTYPVPIFRLRNIDITSSKWRYSIMEDDETNDNLLEWDFNQNPFTSSNQIALQFLFFADYWLEETNKNTAFTHVFTKGNPYTYLGIYIFSKSNGNCIGQLNIHMSDVKYAWTWTSGSTDIKATNPNPTLTLPPTVSNTKYYGPHSKTWNDADCNFLKRSPVSNLEDCKIECDNTQECTAFNYYKDKCFLRKCENNKKPSWDYPPYKGYSKYDIVEDVKIPTTTQPATTTMQPTTTPMPTQTLKDKFGQFWKNEGCTTEPVWNEWYEKQNEETLKKDAKNWATLTGDSHRGVCYGLDKSKWPTVRQLLEEKCPLSLSETRGGVVYINPTNGATRDDYLFSGCKAAGTCDTSNIDPISKNILDNLPYDAQHKRDCFCGCWDLGEYEWDNGKKMWQKKK